MYRLLSAAAIAALRFCSVAAAITKDLVTSLPGIAKLPSPATYSGYLDIPGGKHLHYLFYTSQSGKSTDPLILWFNGGPGCSSLEGAFSESGPLWTTTGGIDLQINEYSYNNFSHQIFLEAPACVGFSYSDNLRGCIHNDTGTAADNLAAILLWFQGFPEFKTNDFWISGESYAGIYVPSLAYDVVQYNAGAPAADKINLKGIMVGNGCLGNNVGICGNELYSNYFPIAQFHGHGFVSDKAFAAVNTACGDWVTPSAACNRAITEAQNEAGNDFDIYDLYAGTYGSCGYGARKGLPPVPRGPGSAPRRPLTAADRMRYELGNTCTNDADITNYLNTAAVQTALHVKSMSWQECSNIDYTSDIVDERTTIYPALQAAGLEILIYNGEADGCVPITDNEWWTTSMNYTVAKPWTAWIANDGTLGGYVTEYAPSTGKFTFITIRGAGHMVPAMQPQYAWDFTYRWVNGLPFTTRK